ncbi:MAG: hypothetical protein ACI4EK_03405 [Wujia sp.]
MIFDFTYEKQMENAKREWYNDGREEGQYLNLIGQVVKKVKKRKSIEQIADELETDEDQIKPIYDTVLKHAPEYDETAILEELKTIQNI